MAPDNVVVSANNKRWSLTDDETNAFLQDEQLKRQYCEIISVILQKLTVENINELDLLGKEVDVGRLARSCALFYRLGKIQDCLRILHVLPENILQKECDDIFPLPDLGINTIILL